MNIDIPNDQEMRRKQRKIKIIHVESINVANEYLFRLGFYNFFIKFGQNYCLIWCREHKF